MDASKYASYCDELRRLEAVVVEARWSEKCLFLGEGMYNESRQDGDPEWAESNEQCRADSLLALTGQDLSDFIPTSGGRLRCHCLMLAELLGVIARWQTRQTQIDPIFRDIPALCPALYRYRPNGLVHELWELIRELPYSGWPALPSTMQSAADAISAIDEVIRWCDTVHPPQLKYSPELVGNAICDPSQPLRLEDLAIYIFGRAQIIPRNKEAKKNEVERMMKSGKLPANKVSRGVYVVDKYALEFQATIQGGKSNAPPSSQG